MSGCTSTVRLPHLLAQSTRTVAEPCYHARYYGSVGGSGGRNNPAYEPVAVSVDGVAASGLRRAPGRPPSQPMHAAMPMTSSSEIRLISTTRAPLVPEPVGALDRTPP